MFEVELISIGDAPPTVNVFKQIDGDDDHHLSKEEVRAGRGGAHGVFSTDGLGGNGNRCGYFCSIPFILMQPRRFFSSSSVTLLFEPVVEINPLPQTQGHCDIRVSTVYLPQVSLGTHLSTNSFVRMNICVSCALTALAWDQTRASRFVVRCVNHCTTEVWSNAYGSSEK